MQKIFPENLKFYNNVVISKNLRMGLWHSLSKIKKRNMKKCLKTSSSHPCF